MQEDFRVCREDFLKKCCGLTTSQIIIPAKSPPPGRGGLHNVRRHFHPPPPGGTGKNCRQPIAARPVWATTSSIALLVLTICSGASSVAAGESRVGRELSVLASECGGVLKSGTQRALGCVQNAALSRFASTALPMALNLVEASGQRLLGDRFSLTNDLSFQFGDGLKGDLDIVMPLFSGRQSDSFQAASAKNSAGGEYGKAWFFQQGASIWRDANGMRRHDMRFGMVGRSPVWSGRNAILGVSFFQQYNLEHGHSRSVIGFDWAGPRAAAAFNYYLPTTGWMASHKLGYEERALEGMEISGRFDLPHSFELESALSRWRIPEGAGYSRAGRVEVLWRYNRWIELSTGWRETGIADGRQAGWNTMIQISIPLGDPSASPRSVRELARYRGGRVAHSSSFAPVSKLWRPVEQNGQIMVIERNIADARFSSGHSEVTVDFVGRKTDSGSTIQLKVSLEKPAPRDLMYALRLIPGRGENPAVEGEDFSGDPVLVRIPRGRRHEIVSVQLMLNEQMQSPRSLDVRIAPWAAEAN